MRERVNFQVERKHCREKRDMQPMMTWFCVRFPPKADVDAHETDPHHPAMKRLVHALTLVSMLPALACSNGQPSSAQTPWNATANSAAATPAVPLAGRVTDAADILSAEQEARLAAKLGNLERATRHQMVVATVPTLGGRDVADFTRDLANSWGIGRKGYNDGVVLLVAPKERKVRIAVGYGLEKTLTHDVCQEIIDDLMLPRFRQGDVPGGIEAGTDALIARLR